MTETRPITKLAEPITKLAEPSAKLAEPSANFIKSGGPMLVQENFSDLVTKLNKSSASTEKIDEEYTSCKDKNGNTIGGYNKGKNVSYIFKKEKDGNIKFVDLNNDGKIDTVYKETNDATIYFDVID